MPTKNSDPQVVSTVTLTGSWEANVNAIAARVGSAESLGLGLRITMSSGEEPVWIIEALAAIEPPAPPTGRTRGRPRSTPLAAVPDRTPESPDA